MFLVYVDESGDSGLVNSPTRYFVLTGLVVHELRWQKYLEQLLDFRRRIRAKYGLRLYQEIHSAHFITRPGALVSIKRNDRLAILREFADELATMNDINLINIVIDKQGKAPDYDVFEMAWKVLIQRFENTMSYRNFPGPANPDERGMLFPDRTDDKKLQQLLRRMRRYNPVPNQSSYGGGYRNLLLTNIIEDPNFRESHHSHFVQTADLSAYLLYQKLSPNTYMRKKSGHNYFHRLDPILCKVASRADPYGVAYL